MVEKRVKTEPAQNEVESKKAKWSKKTDVKKDIKKEFKGEFKGKKDFKKVIFSIAWRIQRTNCGQLRYFFLDVKVIQATRNLSTRTRKISKARKKQKRRKKSEMRRRSSESDREEKILTLTCAAN